MQKWGGKREVMYTAFRALGRSVDYVQVGLQISARANIHLNKAAFVSLQSYAIAHPCPLEHSTPFSSFENSMTVESTF
jgi:hypothetical protein